MANKFETVGWVRISWLQTGPELLATWTGVVVEVEKVMDVRHEVKMTPWNAEVGRRKNCLLPPPDKSLFVQVSKEPGTVLSLHRYITSDWPRTTYVYLLWTRTLVEKSTMAFLRIKNKKASLIKGCWVKAETRLFWICLVVKVKSNAVKNNIT